MKVNDFKDLKKLIQLCRSTGVEAIEVDGIKMNLGPIPVIVRSAQLRFEPSKTRTYAPGDITEDTKILTDGLTDEQLMFYSAQGHSDEQHS